MTVYERIHKEINANTSVMEMVEYLNDIKAAAQLYCMKYCPETVLASESGQIDISIIGFMNYLASEENNMEGDNNG